MSGPKRPVVRLLQVGLRSAHIAAMGVLLGGLAFGLGRPRLDAAILGALASGLGLLLLDLWSGSTALTQGSGAAVILKLLLLGMGNLFPDHRFGWYLAATFVASIGAHMPGSLRHFSWTEGRVIPRGEGRGRDQETGLPPVTS
ncbi:hypothetical protein [Mesoterricola sediminis]|uniref:Uncharacterized protein n=1 Tax=Mesoterricola sediminis TaxID=2927980 RepID=A0AA48GS50_9BACT|nr:hypothetical protein [Mesoterricola sediminis]BDU75164.1 hypothetical protein METESE_01220 [Mesoterricola sediminis]